MAEADTTTSVTTVQQISIEWEILDQYNLHLIKTNGFDKALLLHLI